MRPIQTEALVDELIGVCSEQVINPPSINDEPDEYISKFAVALRGCIEVLPESSQEQLTRAVNFKKAKGFYGGKLIFDFILRDIQMNLVDDPTYPYETQEEWEEQVSGIILNEKKFQAVTHDMMMWNVGSDVETRVAGIKIVAHTILKDRVNDENNPFSILNVGSARNHTLAMLSPLASENEDLKLPEVEIVGKRLGLRKRQLLQVRINELLAREIPLGDSYGVDVRDIKDETWSKFLEANRFYPSELLDPVKRKRYKDLESIRDNDPKIHQAVGFYGREKIDVGEKRASLVAYSTCLYQSYRDTQRGMIDQGLKDGDFVMIQDFGKVISSNTRKHPADQLEINGPSSKTYTYGLFAFDPNEPKLGVRTLGYWNNGRCEKFMPDESFVDILLAA